MTFNLFVLSPKEWEALAQDAHRICFKTDRPNEMNTFDFVLVCATDKEILSYATIIEFDAKSAYMQHGGAMPNIKGGIMVKRVYQQTINWLKNRYQHISTRIENKNLPMLKLAMSEGLLIHGCDVYKDGIFLHLGWGF